MPTDIPAPVADYLKAKVDDTVSEDRITALTICP
jgi:hypothetical protein